MLRTKWSNLNRSGAVFAVKTSVPPADKARRGLPPGTSDVAKLRDLNVPSADDITSDRLADGLPAAVAGSARRGLPLRGGSEPVRRRLPDDAREGGLLLLPSESGRTGRGGQARVLPAGGGSHGNAPLPLWGLMPVQGQETLARAAAGSDRNPQPNRRSGHCPGGSFLPRVRRSGNGRGSRPAGRRVLRPGSVRALLPVPPLIPASHRDAARIA